MLSVDALRGLVMVVMALDHTRDFVHAAVISFPPEDLARTTTVIFLTRWVTRVCAPAFMFCAGLGAWFRRENGASMIALALLVHLRYRVRLATSLAGVVLHNLTDGIAAERLGPLAWLWPLLHLQALLIEKPPVLGRLPAGRSSAAATDEAIRAGGATPAAASPGRTSSSSSRRPR